MFPIEVHKKEENKTFLVRIGHDIYEMSEHPFGSNGLCVYYGDLLNSEDREHFNQEPPVNYIPSDITKKIAQLVYDEALLEVGGYKFRYRPKGQKK